MKTKQPSRWHRQLNLLLLLTTAYLSGCGGGSTTPNADPTGYYDVSGTATVKQSDNKTDLMITDLEAMVSNNRVMMMSASNQLLYDITITHINGNNFNGSANIFLTTGTSQSVSTATVSGTITTGSSITGTLTGTGAGNGSFSLNYSNQTGTLPIPNDWGATIGGSSTLFLISITNTTTLSTVSTVQDGYFSGCSIAGTTIAQGSSGLYQVSVDITGCSQSGVDGSYSGLAAPQDAGGVGLALAVTKSDGSHGMSADLTLPPI